MKTITHQCIDTESNRTTQCAKTVLHPPATKQAPLTTHTNTPRQLADDRPVTISGNSRQMKLKVRRIISPSGNKKKMYIERKKKLQLGRP